MYLPLQNVGSLTITRRFTWILFVMWYSTRSYCRDYIFFLHTILNIVFGISVFKSRSYGSRWICERVQDKLILLSLFSSPILILFLRPDIHLGVPLRHFCSSVLTFGIFCFIGWCVNTERKQSTEYLVLMLSRIFFQNHLQITLLVISDERQQ